MTNTQTYDQSKAPTEQHIQLHKAFEFFNDRLFGNRLPATMIVMQRHKRAYGYFRPDGYTHKSDDSKIHEIALNPETLSRPDNETLSTLVHEMVHQEQELFGKPSRGGYHNKQWAEWMDRVGLTPSNTGQPGGKRTGQQMTHYITPGGVFETACQELLDGGFALQWRGSGRMEAKPKKKDPSKVKFSCPVCGANAWAKEGSKLMCGIHEVELV